MMTPDERKEIEAAAKKLAIARVCFQAAILAGTVSILLLVFSFIIGE